MSNILGLDGRPLEVPTSDQIQTAQRTLTGLLLEQWKEEIRVRQLYDPAPVVVRWSLARRDIMDHSSNVFRNKREGSLVARKRPPLEIRSDEIDGMLEAFRNLSSRRLVILGDAGTGKTSLAILFVHAMLRKNDHDGPTPVILSLGGWDPSNESFHAWMARRLAEDYPALQSRVFGPDVCSSLVKQGKILPILDGLDELHDEVRPRVVSALNSSLAGDDPLIVTCRTNEFRRAVKVANGGILRSAATVQPYPVSSADACDYLRRSIPPGRTWDELFGELRKKETSPIIRACSSPFNLWLLRKVYVDTNSNPSHLLDTQSYPSARHIANHLMDGVVSALIKANPPAKRLEQPRLFQPRRRWDPQQAQTWLQFLARHLRTESTHDLAWWKLWKATEIKRTRTTFGLLIGVLAMISVEIARVTYMGIIAAWLDGALVGGMMFFIVRASFQRVANRKPAYLSLRLRGRFGELLRSVSHNISTGFSLGALIGLLGWLGYSGVGGFSASWNFAPTIMLWCGLLMGSVFGLVDWAETPQEDARPATPASSLRQDIQLTVFKFALFGASSGMAFGLAFGAAFGAYIGATSGFMVALIAGSVITVLRGDGGACFVYWISKSQIRVQGRCPRRFSGFLEDAHRMGILRGNGLVYQFRNSDLRDRLASQHRD